MKNKKYNYNYMILTYDIGEKRVNKVFKICKKYLIHTQKSVFTGDISPANIIRLKQELNLIIKDNDQVLMFKFFSEKNFEKEMIGKLEIEYDDFI